MIENKSCLVCGGKMLFFLEGRDYLYKTTAKTFELFKCEKCGLEQIIPVPSREELLAAYPSQYYSFNMKENEGILTKIKKFILDEAYNKKINYKNKILAEILKQLIDFGLPLKKRGRNNFLDVGCGDGIDVDLMDKYGWNSYGFDIGEKKIKGKIFFGSGVEEVDFGEIKFDVVRAWHVIEHLPDSGLFLKKIHGMLDNKGKLMLGLPNTASLQAILFQKYWFGRDVPRHLFNYETKNLSLLLSKHNFRVLNVKYNSVNSLAGSMQHLINDMFGTNFFICHNPFFIFLLYPLEFMLNLFQISDSIFVEAEKI